MSHPSLANKLAAAARDTSAAPIRLDQRPVTILTFAACALGLWTVITTFWMIIIAHSSLPLFDAWDYWRWYLGFRKDFSHIFDQHNEHRIILPRLLFLADHLLFKGRDVFLLVCIALIQSGHAVLLWAIGCRAFASSRRAAMFLLGAILTAVLSAQQMANLTTGFQIQFVGVFFAMTCGLVALERTHDALNTKRKGRAAWCFAGCVGAAIAATCSMGNGLLAWIVLAGLAMWYRLPRRLVVALLVGGLLSWALYFHNYKSGLSLSETMTRLPEVFVFATAYLGSPVDDFVATLGRIFGVSPTRTLWASLVGFVGFTFAIRCLLKWASDDGRFWTIRTIFAGELLFLLGSAFLTGTGRAVFPLVDAMTSRYQTPALLFWTCLGILLWVQANQRSTERAVWWMMGVVLMGVVIIGLHQPAKVEYAFQYKAGVNRGTAAIAANVQHNEVLGGFYYNPAALWEPFAYLKKAHKSIFAEGWPNWFNEPLTSHYTLEATYACTGAFESIVPVGVDGHEGFTASGWAFDGGRLLPGRVVLADGNGRILGFGSFGHRVGARQNPSVTSMYTGWIAYMGTPQTAITVNAYLVASDGVHVAPIGSKALGSPIPSVSIPQNYRLVPDVPVSIEGAWAKDGYYPAIPRPTLPGVVYGSWNGSDANTGTIRLGPIRLEADRNLGLPIITGPDTRGLALKVKDAKTHAVLYDATPLPVTPEWKVTRILIPPGARNDAIEIVATDSGNGWGQWFAIGLPVMLP
jgi:hypothetical protein